MIDDGTQRGKNVSGLCCSFTSVLYSEGSCALCGSILSLLVSKVSSVVDKSLYILDNRVNSCLGCLCKNFVLLSRRHCGGDLSIQCIAFRDLCVHNSLVSLSSRESGLHPGKLCLVVCIPLSNGEGILKTINNSLDCCTQLD